MTLIPIVICALGTVIKELMKGLEDLKKKTMEHKGDNYTNRDWCFWYSHQRIIQGTGGLGNKRTSGGPSKPRY